MVTGELEVMDNHIVKTHPGEAVVSLGWFLARSCTIHSTLSPKVEMQLCKRFPTVIGCGV
jgi:hypothetical protein